MRFSRCGRMSFAGSHSTRFSRSMTSHWIGGAKPHSRNTRPRRRSGSPSILRAPSARKKSASHTRMPEGQIVRLRRAQRQALAALQMGEAGIGSVEIAVPEVQIEVKPPAPLFTADDDFVAATRKLIASKALEDEVEI
jgi:hypothetical protein